VKQAALTEAQGQGAALPAVGLSRELLLFRHHTPPASVRKRLLRRCGNLSARPIRSLAIDNIRSMETRVADSLIARRSPALLAGIFAGFALLLASIGTYGVLS